jgi:hypothetical protein
MVSSLEMIIIRLVELSRQLSIYYIIKTTNNRRWRLNIAKPMDKISKKSYTYARTEKKRRAYARKRGENRNG